MLHKTLVGQGSTLYTNPGIICHEAGVHIIILPKHELDNIYLNIKAIPAKFPQPGKWAQLGSRSRSSILEREHF